MRYHEIPGSAVFITNHRESNLSRINFSPCLDWIYGILGLIRRDSARVRTPIAIEKSVSREDEERIIGPAKRRSGRGAIWERESDTAPPVPLSASPACGGKHCRRSSGFGSLEARHTSISVRRVCMNPLSVRILSSPGSYQDILYF